MSATRPLRRRSLPLGGAERSAKGATERRTAAAPKALAPPLGDSAQREVGITTRLFLGVPAPAKLNLFLHITGRRPDGYHELQSVFVPVDLADRLDFQGRDD